MPLVHSNLSTNSEEKTKFLIWEITETTEELELLISKSKSEDYEYNRIASEKRKQEYLASRIALNILLKTKVNVCYSSDGKPFLSNSCYKISISHSRRWIAVVANPESEVGIDIETSGTTVLKVYKRFLSPLEQTELFAENDVRKLTIAWSAKECLYKIIGKTAVDFRDQLRVLPFDVANIGEIKAIHTPTANTFTLSYILSNEYTLVYCTEKN